MNQRAVIYARTSTVDQHTENQIYDLQQLARQRGLEIINIYEDQVSGTRARRPGLDQLHGRCPQRQVRRSLGLGVRSAGKVGFALSPGPGRTRVI